MLERLAPLLFSMIGTDFGVAVRRVKRNALLLLIAGLFLLTAYMALVGGIALLLSHRFGAVAALFTIAIGALVLAAGVLTGAILADSAERRRPRSQGGGAGLLAIGAATLLPVIIRSRALTGLTTLGVIALLASRVPPPGGDGRKP